MNTIKQIHLHATAVSVFNCGVLITGSSGIGKSELALELVDRGHKLIADDIAVVEKSSDNKLIISADADAIGYMHIRGLGFINLTKHYNNFSSTDINSYLDLIIELVDDITLLNKQNISPLTNKVDILDEKVVKYLLPIGHYRHLAVLTENIVRQYMQLRTGYNANNDFIEKHTNSLPVSIILS